MSRRRRTALSALAAAVALALPAAMSFAQGAPIARPAPMQAQPGRAPLGVAHQLAGWVVATDDNKGMPFLILDKLGAHIFAFDADGTFLGSAPVLLGLAHGDDSAPEIRGLKLSQIGDDQRTTPAGRFVTQWSASDRHGTMLWVDLPDAISLHPVMSVNAGEHRLQRIKSSDPEEHRISYGCINVPKAFYDGVVVPAVGSGAAVVYVLPDTKSVREVFPAFAAADIDSPHRGRPMSAEAAGVDATASLQAFATVGPNGEPAPAKRTRHASPRSDAPASRPFD